MLVADRTFHMSDRAAVNVRDRVDRWIATLTCWRRRCAPAIVHGMSTPGPSWLARSAGWRYKHFNWRRHTGATVILVRTPHCPPRVHSGDAARALEAASNLRGEDRQRPVTTSPTGLDTLKIWCPQGRGGSIPPPSTTYVAKAGQPDVPEPAEVTGAVDGGGFVEFATRRSRRSAPPAWRTGAEGIPRRHSRLDPEPRSCGRAWPPRCRGKISCPASAFSGICQRTSTARSRPRKRTLRSVTA